MGVLAKKKIYPTSNEEDLSSNQPAINEHRTDRRTSRLNSLQIQNQLNSQRNVVKPLDDSQFSGANGRNRTFIIRKAFQTGLNQLSSTIKRPATHNRLTKLDSNNVELIQNKYRRNGWSPPLHPLQIAAVVVFILMAGLLFIYFLPMISLEDEKLIYLIYAICILIASTYLILHLAASRSSSLESIKLDTLSFRRYSNLIVYSF